jgi:pantetheine-phosphate adenylyltransferase
LHDGVGNTTTDPTYTAIVCSEETRASCEAINDTRRGKGMAPLDVILAPLLMAREGEKISSTELRRQRDERERAVKT